MYSRYFKVAGVTFGQRQQHLARVSPGDPARFEQTLHGTDRLVVDEPEGEHTLVETGRVYQIPLNSDRPVRHIRAKATRIAPGAGAWIVTYQPVD